MLDIDETTNAGDEPALIEMRFHVKTLLTFASRSCAALKSRLGVPVMAGVLALALAALALLSFVGCVYYGAFFRRFVRAFSRFHKNALASASGSALLPALAIAPQFSAAKKRRLRNTALVALILFAALFVLSYVVCAFSAGSLEFWHAWNWFSPGL